MAIPRRTRSAVTGTARAVGVHYTTTRPPATPGAFAVSRRLTTALLLFALSTFAWADSKDAPHALFATDLAAPAGATTKLTLRGLKLESATGVQVGLPTARARVLGKSRAADAPKDQYDKSRVGDSTIDIELTLPADVPSEFVPVSLVGPAGVGPPCRVLVHAGPPPTAEKEPNDRYGLAQPLTLPSLVLAKFEKPKDVDVFGFAGRSGQRVRLSAEARRAGAATDVMLTLTDARGRILAMDDDSGPGGDPLIEVTLPADGEYRVTAIEASDYGGGDRLPYRLRVE